MVHAVTGMARALAGMAFVRLLIALLVVVSRLVSGVRLVLFLVLVMFQSFFPYSDSLRPIRSIISQT